MEESNIYPEIIQAGEVMQLTQDDAAASFENEQATILQQIERRIGKVSHDVQAQIRTLSLYQLEALAEALLNFSDTTDLINWLQSNDG